ncbi:hypothetical protein ACFL7D_02770 [candidate division KSB1 bacterium]
MKVNTDIETIVKCPLCQHEFDPEIENCHTGCYLSPNCSALKCPECGYEFVEQSSIVNFFRKLFKRGK